MTPTVSPLFTSFIMYINLLTGLAQKRMTPYCAFISCCIITVELVSNSAA